MYLHRYENGKKGRMKKERRACGKIKAKAIIVPV